MLGPIEVSRAGLAIAQAIATGSLLALPVAPASASGIVNHATVSRPIPRQMQKTQMSFNLQYLQLQNSMQNENRQFTMVSNIMKAKNDVARNSISNIR